MFQKSNSIAMLLDVSHSVYKNKRLIDIVQKQLVEFVMTLDEEDLFYLYEPDKIDMLSERGTRISAIGNYNSNGYRMQDLSFAFKQTYYVLAASDEDCRRTFCLITDRFTKKESTILKKIFKINNSLTFDEPCDFLVISLGDKCDPCLSKLCQANQATLLNLLDPTSLQTNLITHFDQEQSWKAKPIEDCL